ncbi:formylglycine-generating enzyme family protein, partial [bacterium]|nr:formylglycine-generating enzyme family protein [bacterium]
LLDAATRWAIMSGDIDLTYEYILDFSQSYDIDSLQYKFDAINVWDREIDRTLNGEDQKSAKIDLSGIALILADDAEDLERFPIAFELLKLVVKLPINKQLSVTLKKRIVGLKSEIDRKEFMDQISMEYDLAPDPQKALLLGKYLCFEKDDWSNGLPFLSICSDSTLAEAAQSEIAGIEDNYAIGNAWWKASLNLASPSQDIALTRALGFYELGFQVTPDELTSQLNETKIFELGKYFLFEKNDLPNAFSVLAQCSNAEFKHVAELELTPAKTLEQTIELGDAWFSIAQSLEKQYQNTAYLRAVLYYKDSVDKTEGLEKARLQKRVIDAQSQIEDSSGENEKPVPTPQIFSAKQALAYQKEWAEYLNKPVEFTNSIGMRFRLIPPGEFIMGYDTENALLSPPYKAVITKPFYLGKYELTSAQYAGMSGKPGDRTPAILSQRNAKAFATWLSKKEKGNNYRLPTEAEWELAHRAGRIDLDPKQQFEFALNSGWFKDNSGGRVHEVGELAPNPFGLHDTFGNIREATSDLHYHFPDIKIRINPQSPKSWDDCLSSMPREYRMADLRTISRGGAFNQPLQHGPIVPWFMYSGRHSAKPGSSSSSQGVRLVLEIN